MNKVFLDANILVYAQDDREPEKQKIARSLLSDTGEVGVLVISTQVLEEFYNICTTKLKMNTLRAKNVLYTFKEMETVQLDFDIIQQGIDISIISQISFWDGLIIAAAASANCGELLTEDMNPGQIIRGVKVVNPFAAPVD
jgi:predicted nucleic acid-binding protein